MTSNLLHLIGALSLPKKKFGALCFQEGLGTPNYWQWPIDLIIDFFNVAPLLPQWVGHVPTKASHMKSLKRGNKHLLQGPCYGACRHLSDGSFLGSLYNSKLTRIHETLFPLHCPIYLPYVPRDKKYSRSHRSSESFIVCSLRSLQSSPPSLSLGPQSLKHNLSFSISINWQLQCPPLSWSSFHLPLPPLWWTAEILKIPQLWSLTYSPCIKWGSKSFCSYVLLFLFFPF